MLRRFGCLILIAAIAIGLLIGGNFVMGWFSDGPAQEELHVIIAPGTSITGAGRVLEEVGAVKSAETFVNRVKIFGGSTTIKAGEFLIPKGASNSDVLAILQGGAAIQRLITVPEGTPSIIVHEKLMAEELLTGDIPVPAEGSVLPDSYSFERGEERAVVLLRMQKAMQVTLKELWPTKTARSVVKSPREAVILASIVEKETALASERRMVAGVYTNRLLRNMPLQADPTIIYPITKGKPLGRRIRRSEILDINDYNTYAMFGMPKGPIANPGKAAIEAVLNPEKTKAVFFVAKGDGGHVFAETYKEHERNVAEWYSIRRQRGEM